jgi:hypothetical protein
MGSHRRGRKRSNPKSQQEHNKSNDRADQVAVAPQSNPELAETDQQTPQHYEPKNHEATIARWTIVVGFFTFVLAVATGYSAYVLNATDHTLKDTLRAQINSSELQLRAYLGMDAKAFDLHCESCDPPTLPKVEKRSAFHKGGFITVIVRNSGQTPAFEVSVHGSWKEMPFGANLPRDFTYPNVEANEPDDKGLVNPGDSIPASTNLSSETIGMINRARNHRATVYFYGQIDFRDAFKKTRASPFCRIYESYR